MLKLPEIYQNHQSLMTSFRGVFEARSRFYNDTSTAVGQSYVEALKKLQNCFNIHAAAIELTANKLPKTKFKATYESYTLLAEKTKEMGSCLAEIKSVVEQILVKTDRPKTWEVPCPLMAPRWLYIQNKAAGLMETCDQLRENFEIEKAPAKRALKRKNTDEGVEAPKMVITSDECHMKLRSRVVKFYLPEIFLTPANFNLLFLEVEKARMKFTAHTTKDLGDSYLRALANLRKRLSDEAIALTKYAENLPSVQFKATRESYGALANETAFLGRWLENFEESVTKFLGQNQRPEKWDDNPELGVQFAFLERTKFAILEKSEKLQENFKIENVK